jgi:predicted small lipoprotein YifL
VTALRPTAVLVLAAALAGCGKKSPTTRDPDPDPAPGSRPAPVQEAKAVLREFVAPGADHAALTKKLRPTAADYEAVFEGELAKKLEALRAKDWAAGQVVAPKRGQTEVLVHSATTEELKAGTGGAANFPGGYKQVADKFKPGLTVYRFQFVEPGKDLGMSFDGLVYVNGNWRIFPKPWQALK